MRTTKTDALMTKTLQSLLETIQNQLTDDHQGGEWLISAGGTEYELAAEVTTAGSLVIVATENDDDGEPVRTHKFAVKVSLTPA